MTIIQATLTLTELPDWGRSLFPAGHLIPSDRDTEKVVPMMGAACASLSGQLEQVTTLGQLRLAIHHTCLMVHLDEMTAEEVSRETVCVFRELKRWVAAAPTN